jgi:hypothetical protein
MCVSPSSCRGTEHVGRGADVLESGHWRLCEVPTSGSLANLTLRHNDFGLFCRHLIGVAYLTALRIVSPSMGPSAFDQGRELCPTRVPLLVTEADTLDVNHHSAVAQMPINFVSATGRSPTQCPTQHARDSALGAARPHQAHGRAHLRRQPRRQGSITRSTARSSRLIKQVAPHQGDVSWMNRRFLVRAVRYLTELAGMDQYLDLGSGLPTVQNTHEVAQFSNPEAKVVYVDIDPICNVARPGAAGGERVHALRRGRPHQARRPSSRHPEITGHLDLDRPLVLMQIGTLHHVSDDEDPVGDHARTTSTRCRRAPTWCITHFWDPGRPRTPSWSKQGATTWRPNSVARASGSGLLAQARADRGDVRRPGTAGAGAGGTRRLVARRAAHARPLARGTPHARRRGGQALKSPPTVSARYVAVSALPVAVSADCGLVSAGDVVVPVPCVLSPVAET